LDENIHSKRPFQFLNPKHKSRQIIWITMIILDMLMFMDPQLLQAKRIIFAENGFTTHYKSIWKTQKNSHILYNSRQIEGRWYFL
jgi:hypothetical protein